MARHNVLQDGGSNAVGRPGIDGPPEQTTNCANTTCLQWMGGKCRYGYDHAQVCRKCRDTEQPNFEAAAQGYLESGGGE